MPEPRSVLRRAGDLGAVGGAPAHLRDRRLERVVRRLAGTVPPEQTGLPATELVLVEQLEVQEAGDRRLAVREQDRVPKLGRLIDHADSSSKLRCARGDRVGIVLASPVEAPLVRRWNRRKPSSTYQIVTPCLPGKGCPVPSNAVWITF